MISSGETSRWEGALLLLERQRLRLGWTRDELARRAGLSRTTLFNLERRGTQQPRLSTTKSLAKALELDYLSLIESSLEPTESLPSRDTCYRESDTEESPLTPAAELPRAQVARQKFDLHFDRETNPCVTQVVEEFPELFQDFGEADWNELFSCMGMGGALTPPGVRDQAQRILKKRQLVQKLEVILETHLSEVATAVVETLFEQIQVAVASEPHQAGWQPPVRQRPPGSL